MKEKELSPVDLELSRKNFELAAQQNTERKMPLTIDFDEIAKRHFPKAVPRLLKTYQSSRPCVQAFLLEVFAEGLIGKYKIVVLAEAETCQDLKNFTAIDDFLALVFFAIHYEINAPEERAKLYQMFQEVHIENYISVDPMMYVSRLLNINCRTLAKDIQNAKLN